MKHAFFYRGFIFISALSLLASCQKDIDGQGNGVPVVPANQVPKVGTVWTYRYYTYYPFGGLLTSKTVTLRAQSEDRFGGENWLNIVDVDSNSTVYYLNTKATGLYQYTNNSANLFCKFPAARNDTYRSFNDGSIEDFTVRGVNDTLATGIGDIPVNYYEGVKAGDVVDYIWYNKNAWIVQRIVWARTSPPNYQYYRYSTMYLNAIVY